MPAVSTSTNSPAGVFQRASIASTVVPGLGSTSTRSSPSSAFTSELLPRFGRQERQLLVEQVADPESALGRHRVRLAQAQAMEVVDDRVARDVHLVHDKQ